MLETEILVIFNEPYDSDGYFITVGTPQRESGNGAWRVEVSHWVPDDPDDEDCSSATSDRLLVCTLPTPPTAAEIADRPHRGEAHPDQLAAWARTPVGESLAGTGIVVTERDDG
ncbi:hypothetical protein OG216_35320 [Streptomycetaceae bacterium NBC_01309]